MLRTACHTDAMSDDKQAQDETRRPNESESGELFAIIDESGEGFGFDITLETMARPIAIVAGTLFGVGMLAGVPLGIAMGRATEEGKGTGKNKPKPTFEGLKFAAKTFTYGTLLCGAFGVAGFFGMKWYYQVESFEEFGRVMKVVVPEHRQSMENGLGPLLGRIRSDVGESLPAPFERFRDRFAQSRAGIWIREQIESSTVVEDEDSGPQSADANDYGSAPER